MQASYPHLGYSGKVFNIGKKKLHHQFSKNLDSGINQIAFDYHSSLLAVTLQNGKISVHSVKSGDILAKMQIDSEGKESSSMFPSIKWISGDDLLGVGTQGQIQVWNGISGKKVVEVKDCDEMPLFTCDVSEKNRIFAVAGQSTKVKIYDIEKMKVTTKFQDSVDGHTNRVFALKFNPQNPNILYSGSWDCYVLANDIREKQRVGDIMGPYICGESIDVNKDGTQLAIGSYKSEHYLGVYDLKTYSKLHEIQWKSAAGSAGFVYACKFWTGNTAHNELVAASVTGTDIRVFEQGKETSRFEEINSITGIKGGPLTLDVAKKGNMLAFGTQEGELTLCTAENFIKQGGEDDI